MESIRLTGRNSRLSLLQLEKVKQKIESTFNGIKVEVIARSSRGDALQDVPLHTVEGSDFFTQDIFDSLAAGEADIAVHSLKDMSSEHFFGENIFAVVDRDDTRDVAIFRREAEQKIKRGENIVVGTCSPRREEMATVFLQQALPQYNNAFKVVVKDIRGNVDTRLRKLDSGEYDGIILATAGINRLLASENDQLVIRGLLRNKKLMLLPLVECVPAPCQGAIVAEANPRNEKAVSVLKAINNITLMNDCLQEKRIAVEYGTGCMQRFGVTSIHFGEGQTIFASGKDRDGKSFSNWTELPSLHPGGKNVFSSADHMGNFFEYEYESAIAEIKEPVVYVANYKAVNESSLIAQLHDKKIWASGTRTWFELAKKRLWVEGCADAFGLEFLLAPWQMPLFYILKNDVAIVTNNQSTGIWKAKGWNTYGTYSLVEKHSDEVSEKISEADLVFWTSFRQYLQYRNVLKSTVQHSCSYGETAEQLKAAGISPVVFPNIKAFLQWRKTYSRSTNAA